MRTIKGSEGSLPVRRHLLITGAIAVALAIVVVCLARAQSNSGKAPQIKPEPNFSGLLKRIDAGQ